MQTLRDELGKVFQDALVELVGPEAAGLDPLVGPTRNPDFGDYQCNLAMSAGKRFGRKPRELAQELLEKAEATLTERVSKLEVAGPGFINVTLSDGWLKESLAEFDPAHWQEESERVVIDYSSPNVAKEMHVGHLRSTILGDAISRILEFRGHEVIRQNHLGDWGTQFGMLIAYLKENPAQQETDLSSIEQLYRQANARFSEDEDFQKRARAEVVALHSGDSSALDAWKRVLELSRRHLHENYERLEVKLNSGDERGESFYNDRLSRVVTDLKENFPPGTSDKIEVKVSDGALCVYHFDNKGRPLFENAEGEPLPFIIQKSDGAFLYASTDLAALRFRVEELKADRLIYVTDNRQALHFKQLFATAEGAGLNQRDGKEIPLEHITFGKMLGADRKPLKTRDGGTIKLSELLDEAVERAGAAVKEEIRAEMSDEEWQTVAKRVGIGSIKYADLSPSRQSDYVFTWDKLLSLQGNTVPYLMFAYARCRAIERKAEFEPAPADIADASEHRLALELLRFRENLLTASQDWRLNLWVDYLYGLAGACMKFLEHCETPIIKDEQRGPARLTLCLLTARTLEVGLSLLGIEVVERM